MTAFKRDYKRRQCDVCAKRESGKKKCLVLKENIGLYQDCWAWTDDPDWESKVNAAVHKYRYDKECGVWYEANQKKKTGRRHPGIGSSHNGIHPHFPNR
jgi:hypothetical protein